MKKLILFITAFSLVPLTLFSCNIFKRPLDNYTQFSKQLEETETHIRDQAWEKAKDSLKNTQKTWKKIKPLLQVDIDHDYVNEIENSFTRLKGYIEAKDKSNSVATILSIKKTWESIDQM